MVKNSNCLLVPFSTKRGLIFFYPFIRVSVPRTQTERRIRRLNPRNLSWDGRTGRLTPVDRPRRRTRDFYLGVQGRVGEEGGTRRPSREQDPEGLLSHFLKTQTLTSTNPSRLFKEFGWRRVSRRASPVGGVGWHPHDLSRKSVAAVPDESPLEVPTVRYTRNGLGP